MKHLRVLVVLVVSVALLLLAGLLLVRAQTTTHYDGTCGTGDMSEVRCYGGYTGYDSGAGVPIASAHPFTAALTTIDVTVAANGYVPGCPSNVTFQLKSGEAVVDSFIFTTQQGTTIEFEHSFEGVSVGGVYGFGIVAAGNGCGYIEYVDVYGVGEEEPPTSTPDAGCINDNPELEGSTGWTDINTPTWLTETVVLDQYDGISQTVTLQPGAYTVHITATIDPENLDYKPLTVSLGLTETAQVVQMWGVHYVNFAVSEAGTYTLTIESGYDGQVELGWACLMAVLCVNEDTYLMDDQTWNSILEPEFLIYSGGSGVVMEYMEGVYQPVTLDTGWYRLEVSATLPISFPVDRSALDMCLGASCATSTIATDTTTVALFNVLSPGTYDLSITNMSSSRVFTGSQVVTMTYACLSVIENSCVVIDPDMNNVEVPTFGGVQGWQTVYEDVPQTGGAMLGCDESVEQWAYLTAGTYTMTFHAASDYSTASLLGQTASHVSGTLTIRVAPEEDPSNVYDTYLVEIHSVDSENLGDSGYNQVYTVTFTAAESGNYLLSFGNYDCVNGTLTLTDGRIWLDYVCLGNETLGINRPGRCSTLIDASFQEYNAPHWSQSGAVEWETGLIRLGQDASIAQSVDISDTPPITELVAYVVARAQPGAVLAADLGGVTATWEISSNLPNQFAIFTATLSGMSLPATYTLESTAGSIEIDFTCLYKPGEVPDGDWTDDDDGDTACIEPLGPDFSGGFWEDVAAILRLIWDWIVYGVCIIVHWLKKIWLAIVNWLKEVVVDLGLDAYWKAFMAWLMKVLQGPYDTALLAAFIFSMIFLVTYRVFGLLRVIAGVITLFASALFFALQFVISLIGAAISAIAAPCEALTLSVPVPIIYGVLIALESIEAIPMITYVEWMLIGLMALQLVIWTIGAFSMGGGSE